MRWVMGKHMARSLLLGAIVGGAGVCLAQAMEKVWVNRPQIQIRAGKGAAYDTVATAPKGAELEVIAREDRWLKVRFNGQEGYVLADAISQRQVRGGGLGSLAGGPEASGMTASSAGKGLAPEAQAYANSKGMDGKLVDEMVNRRHAISGAEWAAFAKEGKVGPDKPQ